MWIFRAKEKERIKIADESVDELKVLIPSEYVRNYVLETGWAFTDEQKAVLLVYSGLPLKEMHSVCRRCKTIPLTRILKLMIHTEKNFDGFFRVVRRSLHIPSGSEN